MQHFKGPLPTLNPPTGSDSRYQKSMFCRCLAPLSGLMSSGKLQLSGPAWGVGCYPSLNSLPHNYFYFPRGEQKQEIGKKSK